MIALRDKIVISTRPKGKSEELAQLLDKQGATLLELPMIEIKAASNIEFSKEELEQVNWLVFTSLNGVRYFFQFIEEKKWTIASDCKVISIGKRTTKELAKYGIQPFYENRGNTSFELIDQLSDIFTEDEQRTILLPTGTLAPERLSEALSEYGKSLRLNVYQTVMPNAFDAKIIEQIEKNIYDIIVFTSPSGITFFKQKFQQKLALGTLPVCCIGEVTAQAALKNGFNPKMIAPMASSEGIFQAINNYFTQQQE